MEAVLSDRQSKMIAKIAKESGFTAFQVEATCGSSKGDNYMGGITRVSIKNGERSLNLVLKSADKCEQVRKKFPIRKAYLREIYIYETIFPALTKFQHEQGITQCFYGYPKMYGNSKRSFNEFLILENLKENGYQMWDRKTPMTADHIEIAFREYGKFHAISFAMKAKKPKLYEKLTSNLSSVFEYSESKDNTVDNMALVGAIMKSGFEAVKGHQQATDALKRLSLVIEKFLFEDVKNKEDHLAILHVDCWCNNLLFKYEDRELYTKPTKVCLIDWQLSTTGSPVMDLSQFFFTSATKEVLSDFKRYLQIYHSTVCDVLRKLHCDPEKVFPFDLLERHWQKYVIFGIYQSLMMIKIMLRESHEVIDLAEMEDKGIDFVEQISFSSVNDHKYKKRILDIVNVANANNWL